MLRDFFAYYRPWMGLFWLDFGCAVLSGLLELAFPLAITAFIDHLLPQGDLFVSVDGSGKETVTQSDSVCVKVPMAVIVNGNTYSAAEFFAAALREYDWATIVGQNTTGKGRSQTTIALPDGSAVHISSRKYLTPNRVDLSEQGGLVPDVVVAPGADSEVDAQLEAALSAVR